MRASAVWVPWPEAIKRELRFSRQTSRPLYRGVCSHGPKRKEPKVRVTKGKLFLPILYIDV
jgi:hypothetical protein